MAMWLRLEFKQCFLLFLPAFEADLFSHGGERRSRRIPWNTLRSPEQPRRPKEQNGR